jgi:hypothetical protein
MHRDPCIHVRVGLKPGRFMTILIFQRIHHTLKKVGKMDRMLIGSAAAKIHFPDFREPKDIDYFSIEKIAGADCFWHPALSQWNGGEVATPDELYTIKVSHCFWPHNWNKHTFDVTWFGNKGCKLIPEFYDILYPIWEEKFGKKKANLNVKAEDFFNSRVFRVYDHDSIHLSIAYYDRPLYERILRDGHEVAVSKNKFDKLSHEDKLNLVREEVYATALERQMIPSDYTYSPRAAYAWALKKTVIDFSKGWFPLFIVENMIDLHKPDIDYVKKHLDNRERLIRL